MANFCLLGGDRPSHIAVSSHAIGSQPYAPEGRLRLRLRSGHAFSTSLAVTSLGARFELSVP
ncbi:MAG: hypothetical protein F6J93_08185 [Oscillatoria sp. SIO1A7]|nr:hypothetical protein [Oscillatoria sp. SIO1A7]